MFVCYIYECFYLVYFFLFQAQFDSRRRRLETEITAPLVTDTQTNAIKANVDKNCNATSVEQVQGTWNLIAYEISSFFMDA